MTYLARRYAQALFETGFSDALFSDSVQLILENPPLWDALCSPIVPQKSKEAVLAALPPFQDSPPLLRFYHLLLENGRFSLLPKIAEEFRQLHLEANSISECIVACVHIPENAQQERLKAMLMKRHNKPDIRLLFHIDPTLIGGFVLQLDGATYDHSIRGRLLGLSRHLEEVNAI